jgi:hypothetical protein
MEFLLLGLFIGVPILIFARLVLSERAVSKVPGFKAACLYTSPSGSCTIAISENSSEVVIVDGWGTARRYRNSDIVQVEVKSNGITLQTTNRGSQALGALVGDLVFGPVGFVVGALTGSKRTREKIKTLSLLVFTTDLQHPCYEIVFFSHWGGGFDPSNLFVTSAANKLNLWRGRLLAVIRAGESAPTDPIPEAHDASNRVATECNEIAQLPPLPAAPLPAANITDVLIQPKGDDVIHLPKPVSSVAEKNQATLRSARELGEKSAKNLLVGAGVLAYFFGWIILGMVVWVSGVTVSVIIRDLFLGPRLPTLASSSVTVVMGALSFWIAFHLMQKSKGQPIDAKKMKYGFGTLFVLAIFSLAATKPTLDANTRESLTTNNPIVVTAKRAIGAGQLITPDDLLENKWGTSSAPDNSFNSVNSLLLGGPVFAISTIEKNEPVLASRVSRGDKSNLKGEPQGAQAQKNDSVSDHVAAPKPEGADDRVGESPNRKKSKKKAKTQ